MITWAFAYLLVHGIGDIGAMWLPVLVDIVLVATIANGIKGHDPED